MGCGTSKEAVVSSDGSGRCSRKLFRRKSSVVATGAHQPLAAKDNGDVGKHHKAASAASAAPAKTVEERGGKTVAKGGNEVASTVIGAKIIGEKKAGEEIKKDNKEVAVATDHAEEKGTPSEEVAAEKKEEGLRDKEVVADLIKDDVASATGSVVIFREEEEGTENGEPVEVSIVADERDEEGVSSAGANDEEGWSTEKDIEEIAVDEDDSTVTLADAPVGVATVEDDGALISADAPATEEDEIVAPATVAGNDGSVAVVAAPVAKEDELASFASAPLAEEVDGIILPAAPVAEAVDVAAFTAAPVAKPNESASSIDAPASKEYESLTVVATPEDEIAATVDAEGSTTAKKDGGVMSTAAPPSTKDEDAPTIDVAAPTTTNHDETVASAVAPGANEDESLTLPSASEVELVEAAEQSTPAGNDDELRIEQELPEPTAVEEAASEADVETEQAKEAEEVVTVEEINAEQEEAESVVPQEPEEEVTSAAASRNDEGESDGKRAVDLSDAANTDQEIEGEELSVEEKKDDEEPAVAPIESSSS